MGAQLVPKAIPNICKHPPPHQQAKHTLNIQETGAFQKREKKAAGGGCPNKLGSPRVWGPSYEAQPVHKAMTEMWGHAQTYNKQHIHMRVRANFEDRGPTCWPLF